MSEPAVALDPDVARAFEASLARLRASGMQATVVALGHDIAVWRETLGTIAGYESARANAALLRQQEHLSPSVRTWLDSSSRITDAAYGAARAARDALNTSLDAAMRAVDALVMPSSFRLVPAAATALAMFAMLITVSCAGFSGNGNTPPPNSQTYNITVTASGSGAPTHTGWRRSWP